METTEQLADKTIKDYLKERYSDALENYPVSYDELKTRIMGAITKAREDDRRRIEQQAKEIENLNQAGIRIASLKLQVESELTYTIHQLKSKVLEMSKVVEAAQRVAGGMKFSSLHPPSHTEPHHEACMCGTCELWKAVDAYESLPTTPATEKEANANP